MLRPLIRLARRRGTWCGHRGSVSGQHGRQPQRQPFVGGPWAEPVGGKGHVQGLVRAVGVVLDAKRLDRGLGACRSGHTAMSSSSSRCKVWWNRSTFPVVVGVRGLVLRATMPFSRQIRSNMTSPGRGLVNRPVNCLPLSVRTSSGIPKRCSASTNAAHTARPVARRTTAAITQNREWSSTPDTTLTSVPSANLPPPTMSSCQGPSARRVAIACSPDGHACEGRRRPDRGGPGCDAR